MAGAAPSLADALALVHTTTTNVNQGVTGTYLLVDWLLLQPFGASDVALRLPSLLTGALFLAYSAVFLRLRGAGPSAIALFPIFMLTQDLVMHYAGEARTYMPLAASAVGIVAYYSLPWSERNTAGGRILGWSAVLLGVLFHPYIALYWPALLLFAFFAFPRSRPPSTQPAIRRVMTFANPLLVIVGTLLYSAIALVTWARGKAEADVDPFNFLPGPLPVEILAQNLYALNSPVTLVAVVLFAGTVLLGLVVLGRATSAHVLRSLGAPVVLVGIAFVLSLFISWTSIRADFWIFPRQWIASAAITALTIFWAGWLVWRGIAQRSPKWGRAIGISGALALVLAALPSISTSLLDIGQWSGRAEATSPTQADLRDLGENAMQLSDPEWMAFAQTNVDQGGEVWPELWPYYRDTDWSVFSLRDGS